MKFESSQYQRFAQYIVSRYAAYNVIWILSGEYDEVYTESSIGASEWENHGNFGRQQAVGLFWREHALLYYHGMHHVVGDRSRIFNPACHGSFQLRCALALSRTRRDFHELARAVPSTALHYGERQ